MPSSEFLRAVDLVEWIVALTAMLTALVLLVAVGPRGRGRTMLGLGLGLHVMLVLGRSAVHQAIGHRYLTLVSIALAVVSAAAWLLVALGLLDLVQRASGIAQAAPAEPRDTRVPGEGSATFER